MYTDGIQRNALKTKMLDSITVLAEVIGDSDEAIDSHGREPSAMHYRDGFEYGAPAWLSYYSSTGTGTAWQDKLIEGLEQLQADEWQRQHPDRAPLFDVAGMDDSPLQEEAHEWLDAALEDEAIYLNLEIYIKDSDVVIRAEFTDAINAPYTSHVVEIDESEFMAMDDKALDELLDSVAAKVYEKPESD